MKAFVPLALAFALSLGGCKKRQPEATAQVDAGTPDAAPADAPFVLVAEGGYDVRGLMTSDGKLIVSTGPMLYEAKADGTLVALLGPAELATLMPDEDTVVGYSATFEIEGLSGGAADRLIVQARADGIGTRTFRREGGKLAQLDVSVDTFYPLEHRGHVVGVDMAGSRFRWVDGSDLPVPRIPEGTTLAPNRIHPGPRGALVAFPESPHGQFLLWKGNSEDPVKIPLPETEATCLPVVSSGDRYVIRCGDDAYALADDRFVRVFNTVNLAYARMLGPDGALYVANPSSTVSRCPPDGPCTSRELPLGEPMRVPTYSLYGTGIVKRGTEDNMIWSALAIEVTPRAQGFREVSSILARGANDVWVFVRWSHRTQIFHSGTATGTAMILPAKVDARVAFRNLRPPARWTGPCNQVYVRLGSDGDALAKRADEIRAALGLQVTEEYSEAFTWALVEGTLEGQHGAGIVLMRRSPMVSLAPMEKAVHALVKTFATGPASEPPAYCTLPVLERKLLPAEYR